MRLQLQGRENRPVIALFIILLAVSAVFLLKPFYDNDFFWHLKTGEWICQHRSLPRSDVFSYTTPANLTPAILFTLTSYWLSQVTLYCAYVCGGMTGIVIVRFLVIGVLFCSMLLRQRGDHLIYASLMLLFAVMILNLYLTERPQTASFVCFGLLLAVIDRIKRSPLESRSALLNTLMLSAVMLLWSNSHGGYLVGQVTLLLFIIMEGIKFAHDRFRPLPIAQFRRLTIACTCALLGSLANPNGYKAILFMLQTRADNTSTQVQEFSSMLEYYTTLHPPVIIVYFAVMALTAVLILRYRSKTDLTEVVLLGCLAYFACRHIRYAAFFPIAALPLLGMLLSDSAPMTRWTRRVLPIIAIIMAVMTVRGELRINTLTAWKGQWINDQLFPEKAADFILAGNLQGNMYNDYDWGGYLIWRLAPERKVFADGRNLNTDTLALDYQIKTASTSSSGEKVWKQLLQKYDVNYVITVSRLPGGEVTPITNALLSDAEWRPVFLHQRSRSIIFVRNIPENARIISQSSFGGV